MQKKYRKIKRCKKIAVTAVTKQIFCAIFFDISLKIKVTALKKNAVTFAVTLRLL